MALRGRPPKNMPKRLKLFVYGEAGAGKTTTAIHFPKPYLIDTERGAENDQYVQILEDRGGAYLHTTDPDELIDEIRSLISESHDYQTLIIDPLTVIWDNMLDANADKYGTDFGKHKAPAKRTTKHIINLLYRLDMNVVITSHAKAKWVRVKNARGKEEVSQEGITFECYDSMDYAFDLVLEVTRRGRDRVARVVKSRLTGFPEDEVIDFAYPELAQRYGLEHVERASVPVELASLEQVADAKRLIQEVGLPDETVSKWLEKARASSWDEMPAESITKCIAHLEGLTQGATA